MNKVYKALLLILGLNSLWIFAYLSETVAFTYGLIPIEIIPYPYFFYVVWWYFETLGPIGLVILGIVFSWGLDLIRRSRKTYPQEKVNETLAEKRP